jgi:tetratricopeptide (TPR) repeat protein
MTQALIDQSREILKAGDAEAPVRAERFWRTNLRKAPKQAHSCCWSNLGEVLAMQGRHSEAIEAFEASLIEARTDEDRLRGLAGYALTVLQVRLLSSAPRLIAELQALKPSLTNHKMEPWLHAKLAELATLVGDRDLALSAAQDAVACVSSRDGGKAEAYSALSAAKELVGDLEGAIDAQEHALCFATSRHCRMDAYVRLAKLCRRAGKLEDAETFLGEALRLMDVRDRNITADAVEELVNLIDVDPQRARRAGLLMVASLRT